MEDSGWPSRASLNRALECLPGLSSRPVRLRDAEDLSPGIGTSRVFRVVIESPGLGSLILKIPDWGGKTLLDPRDRWLPYRERAFFGSGLATRLPVGLRAPNVLRIEEREGRTWIWMEDLGSCLERTWCLDDAMEASQRSALLYATYRDEGETLAGVDWLEREGYAAYVHHIPRAHENLDRVSAHPAWSQLFSPNEIIQLHYGLDASGEALAELRRLPLTLVHGDFHIRNLGFDPQGNLVCIDWAHVGLAPLGSDIAVLASLYHAFGGASDADTTELDREIVAAYAAELERLTGETSLFAAIGRAFALWHVTWGLHLRLGPGLSSLLGIISRQDAEGDNAARDIREGCKRALFYVAQMSR